MTTAERHDGDTDVLIIGGGTLGATAAYYLAREGIETTLVERGELNREASGANAGSLHFQILRQVDYEPDRLAHLRPAMALYAESARIWRTLEADVGMDLGVRRKGGLMLAQSSEQLALLERKSRLEREVGIAGQVLSRQEALALCPHLSDTVLGADYCPDEGSANPLLVTPAFALAASQAGATILTHAAVSAIEMGPGGGFVVETGRGRIRAKRIVNAAGSWAASIAAMVGLDLPVGSRVIQVNVTEPSAPLLGQMIQHVQRRLTLKQTAVGTFLLGGGWPAIATLRRDRNPAAWESVQGNAWVAASVLPPLSELRIVRTWAAAIPTTPRSMIPLFGELPGMRGIFAVASGVGFTLGPILGRLMSELLTGRSTSLPVDTYSIENAGRL